MNFYPITIEQEHIKPFIEKKLAAVLEIDFCKNFNNFISTKYPWHEIKKNSYGIIELEHDCFVEMGYD